MNKFSKNNVKFFDYEMEMFQELEIEEADFCKIGQGSDNESWYTICNYFGKIGTDKIFSLTFNISSLSNGSYHFSEVDIDVKWRIWQILNGYKYYDHDFFSTSYNR